MDKPKPCAGHKQGTGPFDAKGNRGSDSVKRGLAGFYGKYSRG